MKVYLKVCCERGHRGLASAYIRLKLEQKYPQLTFH